MTDDLDKLARSACHCNASERLALALRVNQRMHDALDKIERTPAWGYPDKWETTPAEVRQLARSARDGGPK